MDVVDVEEDEDGAVIRSRPDHMCLVTSQSEALPHARAIRWTGDGHITDRDGRIEMDGHTRWMDT